jgi:hypothetical protein
MLTESVRCAHALEGVRRVFAGCSRTPTRGCSLEGVLCVYIEHAEHPQRPRCRCKCVRTEQRTPSALHCQRLSDRTLLDVPTRARHGSVRVRDLLVGGSAEGVVAAQRSDSARWRTRAGSTARALVTVSRAIHPLTCTFASVSNTSVKHRRGITRPECTLSDRASVRKCRR